MVPEQRHTKLNPKAEQHIFTGIAENTKAWRYYNTQSKTIQTSRNIILNKEDTKLYPILEEEAEEICALPPTIPPVTIVEVNDIEQAPTLDMEIAAPSTGMPDPGPWCSGRIANQGTCPDYTNRTCDCMMVACKIVTEPENLKEVES